MIVDGDTNKYHETKGNQNEEYIRKKNIHIMKSISGNYVDIFYCKKNKIKITKTKNEFTKIITKNGYFFNKTFRNSVVNLNSNSITNFSHTLDFKNLDYSLKPMKINGIQCLIFQCNKY
jgi:hypothetical protein